MDYEELSALNKEFAEMMSQMGNEFTELFRKWITKSPRLGMIGLVHLPINVIMMLMDKDEKNVLPHVFPEFPQMFARFLLPVIHLHSEWGKVSSKEFAELYGVEYQKQFKEFIPDEKKMKDFKEWFEADTKKHEKKKAKKNET